MNIVDNVTKLNSFIQLSFRNGMETVERIHQATFEIPLDMAAELGFPKDRVDEIKGMHRRILSNVYGTVCSINSQMGALVVRQVGEVKTFADDLSAGDTGAAAREPARRKKAAQSPASKSGQAN